jgi:hypothetical protein
MLWLDGCFGVDVFFMMAIRAVEIMMFFRISFMASVGFMLLDFL